MGGRNAIGQIRTIDCRFGTMILSIAIQGSNGVRPASGKSLRREARAQLMLGSWPVKIMLDVILAGPNNLDRCINSFRNLYGLCDKVGLNPATETAACECHMDSDGFEWEITYV